MKRMILIPILLSLVFCDVVYSAIDTITVIQPQPTQITITSSTSPQVTINTSGNDTLQLLVPGTQGPQGPKGVDGDIFAYDTRNTDNLPVQYDIVMVSGIDYSLELTHTDATGAPINLAGSTFYAQYRSAPGGTLYATFNTPVINPATGKSVVSLSGLETQALSGTTGYWDLLRVHSGGVMEYRMSGTARVQAVVTIP